MSKFINHMSESWVQKYIPQSTKELVGRQEEISSLAAYISGRSKKPVLLAGPPGSGKTSLVHAFAQEHDFEIIEVNASDSRNKAAIDSVVGNAVKQQSLFMRKRLVLVDEVDGVAGNKDRGGVAELTRILKSSNTPVILTANDGASRKLKALRKVCTVLTLDPLPHSLILQRLLQIGEKEGVAEDVVKAVARRSGGDLRAAINDLQTAKLIGVDSLGERDVTDEISNALIRVFKTTNASVAKPAYDAVSEDISEILMWVDENLPKEYKKPQDIARAYDMLSRADVFFGRIRRWQYYRFYVYMYTFLSVGVALAKDEKYPGMSQFERSNRPLKIWIANNANARRKAIAEKIAEYTHASVSDVTGEFAFWLRMSNDQEFRNWLVAELELSKEEDDWIKKKM